jgi:hypothetical protein
LYSQQRWQSAPRKEVIDRLSKSKRRAGLK